MKFILFNLFLLISFSIFGQTTVSVCSWNLKDFGTSKNEIEIAFIAKTVKQFDVIAIQEVVAGPGGSQAVARLADALNRSGDKWDYSISNITSGSAYKAERYAFIWKTNKVKKVGEAWLEKKYGLLIDREPYYIRFNLDGKIVTLVNFHAITKTKQPETEIKYFKFLPASYPDDNLIFCGDFNLPQSHTVFNPLRKMGYVSALAGQKTSLKKACALEACLASEFDNFYFNKAKLNVIKAGVIHFYQSFPDLSEARFISDHLPVYIYFSLN